ncbi:hypothetical protein BKA66DRAFT_435296 [Pyrenochaeta sp. MPI-SDFR-AT-0127]|nr:hypothetical protein BKA66DRAFT_435296 [Pyrenochaeta sp. MPI-SDFR-AT-0127]
MDSDAIPPSSPPPPPHAVASNLPSSPFFEPQDIAFTPKSSSPPPLFSSDDSRESVDVTNYESPRIYKNKRKGTWWNNGDSAHNTPEPKKTKMSRNFDSGVYMMSDASNSSEDMLPQHKSPFGFDYAHDEETAPMSASRAAFSGKLRAGLERNLEVYEFTGCDLEDGDIEQIGSLASIIKNLPDPGDELPGEGQYRSMVPELYVGLSQNNLHRLTPSLFNIQALTTLILRNNRLEELPQQIGQLRNLKTLDVSLNHLKHFPFEIIQLLHPHGSLERLTTLGNPLLEPMPLARFSIDHTKSEIYSPFNTTSFHPYLDTLQYEANVQLPVLYDSLESSPDRDQAVWRIRYFESWANAFGGNSRDESEEDSQDQGYYEHHPALSLNQVSLWTPRYMARTLVSYSDQVGNIIKGSAMPASNDQEYPVIIETDRGTYGTPSRLFLPPSSSRVASLVTTTLHNALQKRHNDNYTIEGVRELLLGSIPHDANAIFQRALENDAGGYGEFRPCHVCRKEYVVSRAEWVEFWSVRYGVFYPFRVKVCSWGCVPKEMRSKPEKVLAW